MPVCSRWVPKACRGIEETLKIVPDVGQEESNLSGRKKAMQGS